jgi:hypothetical protein
MVQFPQEKSGNSLVPLAEAARCKLTTKGGAALQFAEAGSGDFLLDGQLPLKVETVKAGGQEFQSMGRVVGNDYRRYYWTTLNLTDGGRYRLTLAKAVPGLAVSLDNRAMTLEKGGTEAKVWLTPGRHLLLLSGARQLPALQWESEKLDFTAATMLPAAFRPGAQALVIEAEKAAAEGEVKSQAMDKVGASGGRASCVWDTPGQWGEWIVAVPREGDYRLLIRGCSEQASILRTVEIDRDTLRAVSAGVALQSTGGWARTTDDWRYFAVNGKDGQALRLHLTAGEHRLRLEALGGSMNLDLFAFEALP